MTVPSGAALIDVANSSALIQTNISVYTANRNPQSLVISPYNGDLYMMQVDESNNHGDITLNRYIKSSGQWTFNAFMHLHEFGHGVVFGIWYKTSTSTQHFFSEAEAGSNGRGQKLTNFIYSAGEQLDNTGIDTYDPGLGSDYSCVVDPTNTYIAVRYKTSDGTWHYQAYYVADFMDANYSSPLVGSGGLDEVPDDDSAGTGGDISFQGWTVVGHYLYTISQTNTATPDYPVNTVRIRSYDMNHSQNGSGGYIKLAHHGHPSPGDSNPEWEGITYGDSDYALYYMLRTVTSGVHYFNLHAIQHN